MSTRRSAAVIAVAFEREVVRGSDWRPGARVMIMTDAIEVDPRAAFVPSAGSTLPVRPGDTPSQCLPKTRAEPRHMSLGTKQTVE